jgi:hypothetical protein
MSRDFRNERGFSSNVLRPKDDETPDEAVERLRKEGWTIDSYYLAEDESGLPILRRGESSIGSQQMKQSDSTDKPMSLTQSEEGDD